MFFDLVKIEAKLASIKNLSERSWLLTDNHINDHSVLGF